MAHVLMDYGMRTLKAVARGRELTWLSPLF